MGDKRKITIWIDSEQKRQLDEYKNKNGPSISWIVKEAIREWLELNGSEA